MPRFQAASGSSASLGLAAAALAAGAGLGPSDASITAAAPGAPFLVGDPPTYASSALARAEVERLRRERRALLSGGGGGSGVAAAAYTASHPLVRHVDRLTVLAERQAASLQARGL
jgi:hypothetical protein